MKRSLAVFVIAALLFAVPLIAGCGGNGGTGKDVGEPDISKPAKVSTEVFGTYMVKGQSAMNYSLTLYPDMTFTMIYEGAESSGTYAVSGDYVTLSPGSGAGTRLKKTGNGFTEEAPGGVTWDRA